MREETTAAAKVAAKTADNGAAIAAGCTRALRLSRYVERALGGELRDRPPANTEAVAGFDPALARLHELAAAPWTARRIGEEYTREFERQSGTPVEATASALRKLRRRVLLGLIARDVAGVAALAEIVGSVTALAELAVPAAVAAHAHALAVVHGVPQSRDGTPQDLLVVAMGKGGGAELNVSSDLDLVFVYDTDGDTAPTGHYADARRPISNHEFFEKLGRRLSAALSEVAGDGFVFRIDLRLRPQGDGGPLAVSTAMLEDYLLRHGREWERFAWLKGRVISRALFADAVQFAAQADTLTALVRPFVFRKYFDFNAIVALRDLHDKIRAETQKKTARKAGGHAQHDDNVKLGRGGIREIEFIAQTFQIIRGGRDARLRDPATLPTLDTLAALGILPRPTATTLAEHYVFLRRLEHALQYVDDAQTHLVPADAAERDRVAQLLGLADGAALMAQYEAVREQVAEMFDTVLPDEQRDPADALPAADAMVERLREAGVQAPEACAQRIAGLLTSRRIAAVSASVRASIEHLLAQTIDRAERFAVEAGIDAEQLLARLAQLIEAIAGRSTYVALLAQYPRAFERVLRVLAASRWATDYLAGHPILLDELLDARLTQLDDASAVDWQPFADELRGHLAAHQNDPERQMNLVRDEHHAQLFRLLVADLDGRLSVERLADHLSALADATLQVSLEQVWRSMPRRHRDEARFAIVGYGKLGGKELGYVSDLDLVFVYDDEHPDAQSTYIALARRLMLWLTTLTPSGTLFDVDLRLRPDGDKGLIAAPVEAFERYQRVEGGSGAWTWEHQALTRARFVAGHAKLGERIEALRNEVLSRPRDRARLAADVVTMRKRMLDGHPNRSAQFDLKHDRGGMVDIEFMIQFLVLAYAHAAPRLLGNLGNIALLKIAAELKLIDVAAAERVAAAYRRFRKLQHGLRLNGVEYARVPPEDVAAESAAVQALWNAVFDAGGS